MTQQRSTSRRGFLKGTGAAALGAASIGAGAHAAGVRTEYIGNQHEPAPIGDPPAHPVVIASANGAPAVTRAMDMLRGGADTARAVVAGVGVVEADPNDMTVGYGGLPNERGVVQLDASVMHGPTHRAGSVAALEDIVHAAGVALTVLQTTDHVMLVGAGARDFAVAHGFEPTNLLSDRARQAWLDWKRNASPRDDWLDDDQRDWDAAGERIGASERNKAPTTTGTIHCAALNTQGELSACTTTSGLSYKIPGRVGDSPIVGAGMYVDNAVGAAGATGRGEAVIQSCGAFSVVRAMERGLEPGQACLEVLAQIVKKSALQKRHRDEDERVNFNVTLYALRRDGTHGAAAIHAGGSPSYTASDPDGGAKVYMCRPLYGPSD